MCSSKLQIKFYFFIMRVQMVHSICTSHQRYLLSFLVDITYEDGVCANQGVHPGSSAMLDLLYGRCPLQSPVMCVVSLAQFKGFDLNQCSACTLLFEGIARVSL